MANLRGGREKKKGGFLGQGKGGRFWRQSVASLRRIEERTKPLKDILSS